MTADKWRSIMCGDETLLFLRKSQRQRSQADYFKLKRSARICSDCLKICRDTLDGIGLRQRSGVYRHVASANNRNTPRKCSFCGDGMKVAGKLLGSPLDGECCSICPHCVGESENAISQPAREPILSRLVRLIWRGGSKFMDLSGSGQQLR